MKHEGWAVLPDLGVPLASEQIALLERYEEFLVERAARCQTQDEEGDGDDSEEGRDESGNAPEHVVHHGGAL